MVGVEARFVTSVHMVPLDLMRRAPPWQKLRAMDQLNQAVRLLALQGLRQRHPRASESELRRRLADLILGAELAAHVYGPFPENFEDTLSEK